MKTSMLQIMPLLLLSAFGAGCSNRPHADDGSTAELMIHYGCPTCHVIPNVPGAIGKVGPSLEALAQRSYVAGVLPNTPANLEQWVMHPQTFQPGVAMPEMGVSREEARRIAGFLERPH